MDAVQQSFEEALGNYFGSSKDKIQVNEEVDLKNITVKVRDNPAPVGKKEQNLDSLNVDDYDVTNYPRKRARKSQSILLESGFHEFLPKGWKKEVLQRTTGQTAGKIDVFFYSPSGKRLRSKVEIADYAEKNKLILDIESFSFTRTRKKNADGSASYVGLIDSSNLNDKNNSNDCFLDDESGHLKTTNAYTSRSDKENGQHSPAEHIISFGSENFDDFSQDYPLEFSESNSDSVFKIEKHISFSGF